MHTTGTRKGKQCVRRPAAALLGIAAGLIVLIVASTAHGTKPEEVGAAPATPASESASQYPPYTGRGLDEVRGEKTGFFHTEKQGDTWWLIDPNGKGFYVFGVQVVDQWGDYRPDIERYPYNDVVLEKYGSGEGWAEVARQRLEQWGFNTLGQSSSEMLKYRGMPHMEWLWACTFVQTDNLVPGSASCGWTGFPNVFSPEWPAFCDEQARKMVTPHRDDPWLLGYYLDNELQWWGTLEPWVGECAMALEGMKKPADHSAKQAWVKLVRELCPTIEDFNEAWETEYVSFDELAACTEGHIPPGDEALDMTRQYLRLAADLYFRETTEAIRRYDPNHMILGCRVAVYAPDAVWEFAGKYCDVMTFNLYPHVNPDLGTSRGLVEHFQGVYDLADKPIFLTEWSIVAQSHDNVTTDGMAMHVFDQKQRASAAASFQRTLASLPFMVGTCWLMYIDSFAGQARDYNYNCGLVDRYDAPHEELTGALAAVHQQVAELHAAGVLDSVYDAPPPVRWSRPLPEGEPLAVAQDAIFRSGALELAPGANGAWAVSYDGHQVAAWSPVLWRGWTEDTRMEPTGASITAVRRDGQFTVVDAEFQGQGADGATFKAGWRFWMPAGSSEWAGAQCLWIENTASGDLNASYLVHWMQHEGGIHDDPGTLSRANAQGFYIPLGAVDYPAAGVGFGVTVIEQGADFIHTLSGLGSSTLTDPADAAPIDSFCRQMLNLQLEAGQRQSVDGPVIVMFGYGADEPAGLLTALKERVKQVRTEAITFCSPVQSGELP